jgi:hypothetical protein
MRRFVLIALHLMPAVAQKLHPMYKPKYVKSGATLSPTGAVGFYAGTKCGEVNTFAVPSTAGSKLRVQLIVPATAERKEDDRWSMQIARSDGAVVFASRARWCVQPDDDAIDARTLVATRTIHRYPQDRRSLNNDWNSSISTEYVIAVTRSCSSVLKNGSLATHGQQLPSAVRDSRWLSQKDGVSNFALLMGDIETEYLNVGLELTLALPVTIEQAQFWGHVFFFPWTIIPAVILCNIAFAVQVIIKAIRRNCDDDSPHDGCLRRTFIFPTDPPLYLFFAVNSMSLMSAILVNRVIIMLVGVAFVPGVSFDEVIVAMLFHLAYPGCFILAIFLTGMLQPCLCCCCIKPPRPENPEDNKYSILQIVLWVVQSLLYLCIGALTGVFGIGYFVVPALLVLTSILCALNILWHIVCTIVMGDEEEGMTPEEIEMMKRNQNLKLMNGMNGGTSTENPIGEQKTKTTEEALPSYDAATKPGKINQGEMVL